MKKAFIQLHIAVVLAGFTGIFGKLITLKEGLLTWYRIAGAAVMLLILLAATKKLKQVPLPAFIRMAWAGLLLALHWVFFYASIKYANISVGVVCFSLVGFFTAIFAPLINRKKIIPSELLLSLLTLIGISLIFSFDAQYRTGIILGIISSAFASLYTINSEKLARTYRSELITVYTMTGGTLGLSLLMPVYLYFFPVDTLIPSLPDAGYLFLLSLFCTVLLYLLQTEALKKLSAFTVNLTLNLEPLYAIILAILIYKEDKELTPAFYLGLGLIVLSVVLQMIKMAKQARPQIMQGNKKEIIDY